MLITEPPGKWMSVSWQPVIGRWELCQLPYVVSHVRSSGLFQSGINFWNQEFLFRHFGRTPWIGPLQGLYLHSTTQHRKICTCIHALSGISTCNSSIGVIQDHTHTLKTAWPLGLACISNVPWTMDIAKCNCDVMISHCHSPTVIKSFLYSHLVCFAFFEIT
jgi:hypothetical protein